MDSYATVKDILTTKGFEESRLVAGHEGLNRYVKTVTVAEVPDAMEWLRGGELVVTTAYYLKDDSDAQEKWVKGLIENGAVALAIKSTRFIGNIPDVIRKMGDCYSFPVIELARNVTWPLIIESVTNLILDRQSAILKHSEEVHNQLTKLVINSKGLGTIAQVIGRLVHNPIIIEDKWFNLLAVSDVNPLDKECIGCRTSYEYQTFLRNRNNSDFALDQIDLVIEPLKVKQRIIPVRVENIVYGYLTVILSNKDISERDKKALEHGITVIALELIKERAMFEAQERLRLDMLRSLLDNIDADNEEFKKKASIIGFDLRGPVVAVIIRPVNNSDANNQDRSSILDEQEVVALRKKLDELDKRAFIICREDEIVAFLHPRDTEKPITEMKQKLKNIISDIHKVFKDKKTYAGIGNAYYNAEEYKRSYQEAQSAVSTGHIFRLGSVICFEELGYFRFLSLIKKKDLEKYCQDTLGKIVDYDKENGAEFLLTLERFLCANGNLAMVARQMYLHVNTVKYRITRLEKLLLVDLNKVEIRVNLFLALNIYRNMYK